MSTGLKYWLTATAAGVAFAGVWLLPPATQPARDVDVTTAEAMRFGEVDREFNATSEVLRQVRWSDSLSALAVQGDDRITLLVPETENINSEYPARVRSRIEREIAELSVGDDHLAFAWVLQVRTHAQDPDMGVLLRPRTETYAGERDGREYCLQVRVIEAGSANAAISRRLVDTDPSSPTTGFLGACRAWVAHGLPGAGIQKWLENGGINFGLRAGFFTVDDEWISVGGRLMIRPRSQASRPPVEVDRCLAGVEVACAAVFTAPAAFDPLLARDVEVVRRSPATSIGTAWTMRRYFVDHEYLLADLESEFGPDAFSSFWTSEEEVDAAFAEAFGVDIGSWMRGWVDRTMGVQRPGPGLPRSASSGSMVAMLLLLGVAFLRNHERRVT